MKNKILVYDDNCPLCTWYSGLFVKYGFLQADARKAFSSLDNSILQKIDFDKSRNEIPLLDTSTSKVLYGIDALLEILNEKIPNIKIIGSVQPIKWLLKKLYKLISFNRKVIVAKKCGPGSIDCTPDINYRYRIMFLLVSLIFNTLMLYPLHVFVFSKLSFYHLEYSELQAAHFTFVIINCSLAFIFEKSKSFEYLGQVNMLAVSVILLMIPLIFINLLFPVEWFSSIYLIGTAAFVFKEYIRRMEFAGVIPTYKWVISLNLLCMTGFILFLFH